VVRQELQAQELAVEEINAAGGVLGRPLALEDAGRHGQSAPHRHLTLVPACRPAGVNTVRVTAEGDCPAQKNGQTRYFLGSSGRTRPWTGSSNRRQPPRRLVAHAALSANPFHTECRNGAGA
jgi:hypothetical protein